MEEKKKGQSFWTTLPGILTGFAAVLTAIGTLILAWRRPNAIFPATATPTNPPREITFTSEPLITSLPATDPTATPPATEPPATETPTLPLDNVSDNSSPSPVMAGDRLTVFARGADGTLMHKFHEGGWIDWIPLGDGLMTSALSAVIAGERLTVFARSADGILMHKFYEGGWTDWIPLGDGQICN